MNLKKIKQKINKFVKDRDWEQFHSPKNLAMALSVEVSELVEIFQWLKDADIKKVDKQKVAEEFLKTSEQPIEKLLELLDWMATNLHVFVGHYGLLKKNLEYIFKYIHDNKLKIFNENGTYTPNTNEKLIVDYLKVFIEPIKVNNNDEFVALKTNVVHHNVDITETGDGDNKVIVIQEKLLDIDGLLDRIKGNINAICKDEDSNNRPTKNSKDNSMDEFNNINNTVKLLICLKNKAQAQDKADAQAQSQAQSQSQAQEVTEEGEQCPKVTGDLSEHQKNELKEGIKKLFLKLLEKAMCVNQYVFTFLGKKEREYFIITKDPKNKISPEKRNILRTDLWTLYNYISPEKEIASAPFKYHTTKKISEIIGTWNISGGNKHENELIMIYK